MAIDASGTLIAVTAPGEDGAGAGVSGDPSDGDRENAGAVYLFEQPPGAPWRELAYLKSPRPRLGDRVGQAVALEPAGTTLAVGANKESGGAAGVHTAPLPGGSLDDAGATYLY